MPRPILIALALVVTGSVGQSAPPVEEEVLGNIRGLRIEDHTLGDYAIPEPFLRRVSDRVIRQSFRERFHRIARDVPDRSPPPSPVGDPKMVSAATIVRPSLPPDVFARRSGLEEIRPALRGYRADILGLVPSPLAPPPEHAPLASLVARRLARDGLLPTTAVAVTQLVTADPDVDDATLIAQLQAVGLPVDWLSFFDDAGDGQAVVRAIAAGARAGEPAASLAERWRTRPFVFRPTQPGFAVATESGEHRLGGLRLQLTRGRYWRGMGTGGSLDLARQLMQQMPDVSFTVSIEDRFLDEFLATAAAWPGVDWRHVTIVTEPLVVAQWAQDNGKPGIVTTPEGARLATLVPRYASRREEGSVFVPGESSLVDGLAAAGLEMIASPLLFQGGNLLAAHDPATNRRLLLIGEAEIYRNTALGLTREQVLEAFRAEFGVDVCYEMPAVSFHLDYDVSLRAHDGRLLAFVNDTDAALRIVLRETVDTLVRSGRMRPDAGRRAVELLEEDAWPAFLNQVSAPMGAQMDTSGRYPLSLAHEFAVSPEDSPVGNLYRALAALDIVVARVMQGRPPPGDRHAAAYIRSIHRLEADQRRLHGRLAEIGLEVVSIPSLSLGDRSLTAINAIHGRDRLLLPAYGGLFAALDQAAIAAYEARLGRSVRVVVVECGESQRRYGAVHCAAAASPRIERTGDR